jgi:hypothetical protein
MRRFLLNTISIIGLGASLLAITGTVYASGELSSLMNLSAIPTSGNGVTMQSPRDQAVYNAAYTLGAQKGYLNELHKIQNRIKTKTSQMNRIFDFRSLINLSNTSKTRFIIPPVIQKADNSVDVQDHGNYLTIAGAIYRIVVPAHLATAPPTWQQFLLFGFSKNQVTPVNQTLLPKNKKEQLIWKKGVLKGWEAGVKQANTEMVNRERRLSLYYNGMALYEKLLMRHLVTKPFIAVSHQDVSGDSNMMNVDEETYRITVPAKLNQKVNQWSSIPTTGDSSNE